MAFSISDNLLISEAAFVNAKTLIHKNTNAHHGNPDNLVVLGCFVVKKYVVDHHRQEPCRCCHLSRGAMAASILVLETWTVCIIIVSIVY